MYLIGVIENIAFAILFKPIGKSVLYLTIWNNTFDSIL